MKCSEFIRQLTKLTSDGSDPEIVISLDETTRFESALLYKLMATRFDDDYSESAIKEYATDGDSYDQETVIRIW